MGYYLNNSETGTIYREIIHDPFFVDKSNILKDLIPLLNTQQKYICITRPRRFGKTVMANLIGAYFSKACDTNGLFQHTHIAQSPESMVHLNQYNVIYIDLSEIDDECQSYSSYIQNIKALLREDLHTAYPAIAFRPGGTVWEDLKRIHMDTGEQFIFILDEWDAIFHAPFTTEENKRSYLLFLKNLLKGKAYVSLAYMTGILPIAKYSSGSELNMFLEYTMSLREKFSLYFGFTEDEVDALFQAYLAREHTPKLSREDLRNWYNGYVTPNGQRLYNPRSIVCALKDNQLGNYWTSSGPYDEIFYYIKKNVSDIRDDLALMVSGIPVPAKIQEYAATSMELATRDEIFSAMAVYGFLSCENGYVSIPNKELMDRFSDMLKKEPSLGYVYRLARESERMLKATLAGDTDTMSDILNLAHNTESPLLSYSNEAELAALINLTYLSARDSYRIEREEKAGIGYVDFIFYPESDPAADCIILELKVDHSPEAAIRQIKNRQYALRFQPKLGDVPKYTGRILAVGIAYHKATKTHCCKIELL